MKPELLATGYTTNISPSVPAALPAEQADIIKESIGGTLAAADHLAATGALDAAAALRSSAYDAFAAALSHSSMIGAIILGVGTVIVGALLPGRRAADSTTDESAGSRVEPDLIEAVAQR